MDIRDRREQWRAAEKMFPCRTPHPLLLAHASRALGTPARVLVPLCGKAVDLAWLANQGCQVVGVELVEDAARAFFDEQQMTAMRTLDGPRVRWESGSIEIVSGDFFTMTDADLGTFDGAYDRAALISLSKDERVAYVRHLRSLLEPGARILLLTLEHDRIARTPPFSVFEDEVHTLFGTRVDLLSRHEVTIPALSGATFVEECAYSIVA